MAKTGKESGPRVTGKGGYNEEPAPSASAAGEGSGPRRRTALLLSAAAVVLLLVACTGCLGPGEAECKVEEAVDTITNAQPLLQDLVELDSRLGSLGTRFTNIEDTVAEGKSLIEMVELDIDELEDRYTRARALLEEAASMEGSGDYARYAALVMEAVDRELEALALNRDLLTAVSDMLDVLPMAENKEQLSFYVEEIGRLAREVEETMSEASQAAAEADAFREEKGL